MVNTKRIVAAATTIAACAGVVATGVAQASSHHATAAKAVTKHTSGTGYFSIVHTTRSGEQQAAGIISDKLLRNAAVTYVIKLSSNAPGTLNVKARKVVLYTGSGSLIGTATATINVTPAGETISNGKLTLKKGFGSLRGDKLTATFSGMANTLTNQYTFHYVGKLRK